MDYPRPIESIHQIEISSRCNLRCVYCPSRDLDKPIAAGGSGRAMIDISLEHYKRALEWAVHFEAEGTQGELALTGIGEALLHADFVEQLRLAREALPDNPITFSTNGILLTDEVCEAIKEYSPQVYVSLEAFDWAGQLDWDVSIAENSVTCEYLRSGWSVVYSDGRITTCCLDATGAGVVGHVDDEIGSLSIQPWKGEGQGGRELGCGPCHMVVP